MKNSRKTGGHPSLIRAFLSKKMIICFVAMIPIFVFSQMKTITGSIVDSNGQPIIGATVMVKGTSTGTVSDIDGNFVLGEVREDAILQISYIGYATQEISVAGKTHINVFLQEESKTLDELVVVGYGAITKRSLSTAISTVEGDKLINIPSNNLAQSIVGLSSGIKFQQTSGQPGESPAIRIRGVGSINSGNDPLYVIDGYPTSSSADFANINPQDVDNIQILKDAASSAIYGSRAGNGVIIVTTKRGKQGVPVINFSSQIGFSQPMTYVDVLDRDDYIDLIIEARTNNGTLKNYPALLELQNNKNNYPNTNWQNEIFRNAMNQRTSISILGGNDKSKYNFSATYLNDQGILLNSFNKRINVKGGFEAELNKYVSFGVSFSPTYNYTRSQNPSGGNTEDASGIIAQALTFPPIFEVYQSNGDYTQIAQHAAGKNGYPDYGLNVQNRNPVANLLETKNDNWSLRTLNNAYLEIKPLSDLVIKSSIDVVTQNLKKDYYQSAYLLGNSYSGNKSTPYYPIIDGYRSSLFSYDTYWSTTINYNFHILALKKTEQ